MQVLTTKSLCLFKMETVMTYCTNYIPFDLKKLFIDQENVG